MFDRYLKTKLIMEKEYNKLKQIENWYYKLRKDYFELQSRLDELSYEKIEQLEETIEKLTKELDYSTRMLTKYHLHFPDECFEKFHKQVQKAITKNDDEEELER